MKRFTVIGISIFCLSFFQSCLQKKIVKTAPPVDTDIEVIEEKPADRNASYNGEVLNIWDVSKKAEFKDGGNEGLLRFVAENVRYPEIARKNKVEGKVALKFVIRMDGSVTDIETFNEKKLGYGLEEEAIRVVKLTSGKWDPAHLRPGEPCNVLFRLPLLFKLD